MSPLRITGKTLHLYLSQRSPPGEACLSPLQKIVADLKNWSWRQTGFFPPGWFGRRFFCLFFLHAGAASWVSYAETPLLLKGHESGMGSIEVIADLVQATVLKCVQADPPAAVRQAADSGVCAAACRAACTAGTPDSHSPLRCTDASWGAGESEKLWIRWLMDISPWWKVIKGKDPVLLLLKPFVLFSFLTGWTECQRGNGRWNCLWATGEHEEAGMV